MTQAKPPLSDPTIPAHIAVIMDGNGRWARARHRPRAYGHRMGVRAARSAVEVCHAQGVKALTLFAFSQENWHRPVTEVGLLMQLFRRVLALEIRSLHANGVRIRFIGAHDELSAELRRQMRDAEQLTASNDGLLLQIAIGYGGHWDIVQAARHLCEARQPITEASLEQHLVTADVPPPDLLIRTGGERRLSNFMMWQLAYAELYFTDTLWPDFGGDEFRRALDWYGSRERRFGRVPEAG